MSPIIKEPSGILNFRFHGLRHTFANHFVMNCGYLQTFKNIRSRFVVDTLQRAQDGNYQVY